jgi:hypothetical protein
MSNELLGWLLREQKSRLLLPCRKGRRPLSTDNDAPQATFSQIEDVMS